MVRKAVTRQRDEQNSLQQAVHNSSDAVQWERVLWKAQPFPDNYTDKTFLQELVINAHVPERDYWQVAFGSAAIAQQISTVTAAGVVPVHLRNGTTTSGTVLCAACVLLVVGVYYMSPLLRSLMGTVSEDSIIALTVFLMLVHLYLHDYNFVNSVTDKPTGTLSLTAAVFASVLLASCMPSEFDVFVQVLFSLALFLLGPLARRYIRQASPLLHLVTTGAMVAAAAALLAPLSRMLSALFLLLLAVLCLLGPWCLVRTHKFKAKINGPWDEAVPHIPASVKGPPS